MPEAEPWVQGDPSQFRELVRRHGAAVVVLARSYARDADDLEDLVQEVWIRVYVRRAQFRASGSELGWILAVARNVCLGMRRQTRRRVQGYLRLAPAGADEEPVEEAEDDLLPDLDGREPVVAAFRALAELPSRQREAIVLRIIEGQTPSEVAERMGCEKATVRSLIRYGLLRIRQRMEESR
jgi:RNA polymerase sigma-70 factor (ECF subfamily)